MSSNENRPVEGGDAELLPHEAAAIGTVDIPPKVVASMERLYAVPSEKLRVWSAWLTKIGEITDEWRKWLRSNIDLAIRIAEHLEAAEEALRKSKMADGDKADEDLSSEGKKQAASQSVEDELADPGASSAEEASIVDAEASKQSVQKEPSATGTSRSEGAEDPEMPIWPLGVPWQPAEQEDEDAEEEVIEKLPMPRTEEEMKEYLKKFKADAVMYRSYYKHWRETADQTLSEIGGKFVMATFLVQGRREEALKRIAKKQKREKAAKKAAKKAKKVRKRKAKRSTPISSGTPSEESVYVTAPQSVLSEAPEAPETSEEPETAEATEEPEEPDTVEEPKPSSSKQPKSSASAVEKVPSKKEIERDEALDVDELFRNCSRAAEPIPYHFYLRAEPDVHLAGVEDEDDEILEIDLTRSEMIGTLKRLWYNIAEKPCKSGKPWI